MCGRFIQVSPPARLLEHFDCDEAIAVAGEPDWNVTPRREVLVVVQDPDGRRVLDRRRWGLIPSWAREAAMGDRLINARSETAAEKPSFRSAFARRRCIVPVDGFYEWRAVPGRRTKQPVFIHAPGDAPLALAGLSMTANAADPASETGWTDLMENKAVEGNFGAGTVGMTLQQAVFAGKEIVVGACLTIPPDKNNPAINIEIKIAPP